MGDTVLNGDITHQAQLDDVHADFRINHFRQFFTSRLDQFRVGLMDGPLDFVNCFFSHFSSWMTLRSKLDFCANGMHHIGTVCIAVEYALHFAGRQGEHF